jgi:hypothetical protein
VYFTTQGYGIEIEFSEALEYYKSSPTPERLKTITEDGKVGFWQTVYALAMQGRLQDALTVLSLHSEIVTVLNNLAAAESSQQRMYSPDASTVEDFRFLQKLFELLEAHPYAHIVVADDASGSGNIAGSPNLSLAFRDWREQVAKLHRSASALFGHIPELNTLFLLLSGDRGTILEHSLGDWMSACLALLLYVYPPPLTRANLSRVIDEAMEMVPPDDQGTSEDTARSVSHPTLSLIFPEKPFHSHIMSMLPFTHHEREVYGLTGRSVDYPCYHLAFL